MRISTRIFSIPETCVIRSFVGGMDLNNSFVIWEDLVRDKTLSIFCCWPCRDLFPKNFSLKTVQFYYSISYAIVRFRVKLISVFFPYFFRFPAEISSCLANMLLFSLLPKNQQLFNLYNVIIILILRNPKTIVKRIFSAFVND